MFKISSNLNSLFLNLSFLLFPLAIYKLDFGFFNISMPRLVFFCSLLVFLIYFIIYIHRVKVSLDFIILFFFIVYSVICTVPSYGIAYSYLPMLILSFFYFVAFYFSMRLFSYKLSIQYIYASILILVYFTFYTYYVFYSTGKPPIVLPFEGYFSFINVDAGHIVDQGGFTLGNLTRVGLPFSRPQELGMTVSILFFLVLGTISNSSSKYMVLLLAFIIIFLSGSRSAIFPFVFCLAIYFFAKGIFFKTLSQLFSTFIIIFLILSYFDDKFMFLDSLLYSFERLTFILDGDSSSQHLGVRQYVLHQVINHYEDFVFGSGVGSFSINTGISSAHSSFFTILYDLGFVGFFLFLFFHFLIMIKSLKYFKIDPVLFCISLYIFISHFLYHVPTLIIFWIAYAHILGTFYSRNSDHLASINKLTHSHPLVNS